MRGAIRGWVTRARSGALVAVLCAVPIAATAPAAQAAEATHTVSVCTSRALSAAIRTGGVFDFACDGTISLTAPITVTGHLTLDASGHSVALDSGGTSQLFLVNSGTLTLIDLTLQHAAVTGAKGTRGQSGTPGTAGDAGTQGNSGNDGIGEVRAEPQARTARPAATARTARPALTDSPVRTATVVRSRSRPAPR